MDTITIPTTLHEAIVSVESILGKEAEKIAAAKLSSLRTIIVPAQTFAGEWDGFATAHSLTSKAGNIVDSRVIDALTNAGEVLPSQATISRILRIGRSVPAGEAKATLATFLDAEWQQPDDAVAPDTKAVVLTNTQDIKTFASWCEVKYRSSDADPHKVYRIVDDVLIKHDEYTRLTATYVAPEEEVYGTEEEEPTTPASTDATEEEQPAVKPAGSNQVNTGALAAVFATCDDDTVSSSITVDMSQYDTVDELMAVALSALATATLLKRAADRETVAA